MTSDGRIGLALVSAVRHGADYLPILLSMPDIAVRVICEEADAEDWMLVVSSNLAAKYGIKFQLGLAVLERPDIDAVVVCSEPIRHSRLATESLRAGKHVIVDKPVATDLVQAGVLLDAALVAPGHSTVVHRLFSPALLRARKWVDAGLVGLPMHVAAEFLANAALFHDHVTHPDLVVNPRLSGGGELMNFLGYIIDAIRCLTGCEPVEVQAETATLFSDLHRRYGVEDAGIVSLLCDHGVTASAVVGRTPHPPSAGLFSLRCIGSHGYFIIDDGAPHLEVWTGRETGRQHPINGEAGVIALRRLFDEFVWDIRENRTPLYGIADACTSLATVDAAYRSAASGQPEPVTRLVGRSGQ